MRPAAPVPIVVQDEGCLQLLAGATGRVSPAWLATLPAVVLPPCSATAQHARLPSPCFSADRVGDHGRAGSLGTWGGGLNVTSLCSSRPPWPFLPHLLDTGSDWGSLTLAPRINYPQLSTCNVKRNEKLLSALEIWTNEFSMKSSLVN